MNYLISLITIIFLTVITTNGASAQSQKLKDKGTVYSVSGIGLGMTGGLTRDVISPKVSTKIGFDIAIGTKGAFIYPSVNFLVFNYDQKEPDAAYAYNIETGGRSAITSFTIPVGIRQSIGNLNIYEFLGPGASLVREPRPRVDTQNQQVTIVNLNKYTASVTAGVGAEYILGRFALFAEASYLHNFKNMQDRQTHIIPVFVGFKSDISSVFKGKGNN